jgi:hypothetical protein
LGYPVSLKTGQDVQAKKGFVIYRVAWSRVISLGVRARNEAGLVSLDEKDSFFCACLPNGQSFVD